MLTRITDHLHAMQMQESPPNLLITSSLLHFIFNAEEDIFCLDICGTIRKSQYRIDARLMGTIIIGKNACLYVSSGHRYEGR